ncbi:MAG: phage regulatory CII family protein, partial [Pseudomonadota bacterium]
AGGLTGKSQTQVQRCCSTHDRVNFMNLRDVALLEERAGEHPVTSELAKQAGGVFLPLPDPSIADNGTLALQVVAIADELGDVSGTIREAMAEGGVDAAELTSIESEFDHLIEAAVQGRALVQVKNGKPLQGSEEP